jgi:hypothetical protein
MRYTSQTLSDERDAVRELVIRPIYPGDEMECDRAMLWRRLSCAALLLALLGVACGGGSSTNVAAKADTPAAVVTTTTTTVAPTTAAPVEVAPEPASPATPVKPAAAPSPAPASIEVDYQPAEGSTASATISGPNGAHTKSLESGAAIFGNLPAGTYDITVTIDTPSDDPTIGDARQILNGNSIDVGPGDHATVTCDDNGCNGVLDT